MWKGYGRSWISLGTFRFLYLLGAVLDGCFGVYEKDLVAHLLAGYNKLTRPVRDYNSRLNITVQPQVYSLIEVNELSEQIKLLLWFPQSWKDEFLTWNASEWGGIQMINVPANQVWLPDGYIFNTVDVKEPLALFNVRVSHEGIVEADFNKLIDIGCSMSILNFPFDTQLCSLQFGSWSYQYHQISHIIREVHVPTNAHNSEWEILNFTAEKVVKSYEGANGHVNTYEEVFYHLKIKRKPLNYIVVILIPTFLIVNVSIVGLFTPHGILGDRQEKVSLGLTTLLTMAVILDMVSSEMPKSSEGVPLLGRYVLIQTAISILAIAVSVINIFIHERVLYLNTPVPRWILNIFREEKDYYEVPQCLKFDFDINHSDDSLYSLNCKNEVVREIRSCIGLIRAQLASIDADKEIRTLWQRFFSMADVTAMSCFLILNLCTTVLMFWSAFHQEFLAGVP
ncbi:unnamed protein product, partial [Mesorhabditis belari]|uniref:Uncharacterized protein n=1 Tax=Mesorhabditis belari TaxID=2138241 RepID=A0AAF3J6C2_9BILA